jgi:hypothetical protein
LSRHYPNNVTGCVHEGTAAVAWLDRCGYLHHASIITNASGRSDVSKREVASRGQYACKWEAIHSNAFSRANANPQCREEGRLKGGTQQSQVICWIARDDTCHLHRRTGLTNGDRRATVHHMSVSQYGTVLSDEEASAA